MIITMIKDVSALRAGMMNYTRSLAAAGGVEIFVLGLLGSCVRAESKMMDSLQSVDSPPNCEIKLQSRRERVHFHTLSGVD